MEPTNGSTDCLKRSDFGGGNSVARSLLRRACYVDVTFWTGTGES